MVFVFCVNNLSVPRVTRAPCGRCTRGNTFLFADTRSESQASKASAHWHTFVGHRDDAAFASHGLYVHNQQNSAVFDHFDQGASMQDQAQELWAHAMSQQESSSSASSESSASSSSSYPGTGTGVDKRQFRVHSFNGHVRKGVGGWGGSAQF